MIMGCVKAMARMHAATWNDHSLLKHDYLVGADWMQKKGHKFFAELVNGWYPEFADQIEDKKKVWGENAFLESLLAAQFAKVNFKDYTERLASQNFAVVHGDLHMNNMMWNQDK